MGNGGYRAAAGRWLRLKTKRKKIYGVENRTKAMNYFKTVNRKDVPQALQIMFDFYSFL